MLLLPPLLQQMVWKMFKVKSMTAVRVAEQGVSFSKLSRKSCQWSQKVHEGLGIFGGRAGGGRRWTKCKHSCGSRRA